MFTGYDCMDKLTTFTLLLSAFIAACPDPDHPEPGDARSPASWSDAGSLRDASPNHDARPLDDAEMDRGPLTPLEGGVLADAARPAADLELERRAIEKLKMCGMFEPSVDAAQYNVEDEYDRCTARCLLAAACAQIASTVCDDADNALANCVLDCPDPPSDGFRCRDGSRIPHAALCDLFPDCAGEEDESGCGQFRCADGDSIPARSARCDYVEDCADGSDEQGCAFSCPQ
jgi:hypothetical protein